MAPPLPGPFAHLAPLLDRYGYLAVGALIFLEDFGIPVPGEAVLIAASVYAGAGRLDVWAVAAIAVVAAVAGDNIGYLLGRTGGRALVRRYGRFVFLNEARFATAEGFFRRHGAVVVMIARFVDVLRQLNGLVAGTIGMEWRRFLAFNLAGALLWAGTWTAVGYLAGANLTAIYRELVRYQAYLLVAVLVLAAAAAARHMVRRRRA
ncbi:DedA family protein [Sphaerisporangium corydalis]|uniref:DedA family protein n=1 Tax=Sphaerisporangium corydalis TaxID=1441875 RepID=A0ABV9EPQ7_9ACTN|nr:DedA family protein [Sphaerisporangium corydalis]